MELKNLLVLGFGAAALFVSEPGLHPDEQVDVTLKRKIDVTGDGQRDEIRLYIKAGSFKSPFQWHVRIVSRGTEIYRYDSDDTWLDPFFADSGYVSDKCAGYIECKRLYYFHILDDMVTRAPQDPENAMWDRSCSCSIFAVATRDLMEHSGQSEADAIRIAETLAAKLREGLLPVLEVPQSPVQANFPIAWCDDVQKFIRVYEW